MIRVTGTGKLLLAGSAVLYLASLTSQSSLLLFLIGLLVGCFLLNAWSAWRAVSGLELQVPLRLTVREGERPWQSWKLRNRRRAAAGLISVRGSERVLLRLGCLEAEREHLWVPEGVFRRRGVFPHDQVALSSAAPFGLIEISRRVTLPGEVVVHPAIYPAPPGRAGAYDVVVGGKLRGNRRTRNGIEFAGVRPLEVGDSWKQIHWKLSAKGRGLLVKTFEEELSGRIAFLMDVTDASDKSALENCIRATGSMIFAALDAGHHVEWVSLGDLNPVRIPPFADGEMILDRLARVHGRKECFSVERLRRAEAAVSRRSALCLVITALHPALEPTIQRWSQARRRVSVVLPAPAQGKTLPIGVSYFQFTDRSVGEVAGSLFAGSMPSEVAG